MTDPNACNSRCSMGVNILIDGELYGKCRFAALFFLITSEKYDAIKEILIAEMNERTLKWDRCKEVNDILSIRKIFYELMKEKKWKDTNSGYRI